MPTIDGPFGKDEIAERLHGELMERFEEALQNEGIPMTNEIRQKITMLFLNECHPEWVQKRMVTAGIEHKTARALTLGVMREWQGDPRLAPLFKHHGQKEFWGVR